MLSGWYSKTKHHCSHSHSYTKKNAGASTHSPPFPQRSPRNYRCWATAEDWSKIQDTEAYLKLPPLCISFTQHRFLPPPSSRSAGCPPAVQRAMWPCWLRFLESDSRKKTSPGSRAFWCCRWFSSSPSYTLCFPQEKTGRRHGGIEVCSSLNELTFFPASSATNAALETGCFRVLEEMRHQIRTEYKPPSRSLPISVRVRTLEVSCRGIIAPLSFLSGGTAAVAPRKWCSYDTTGNEILSGMKCNFTERPENPFLVRQIRYTTQKYTKYKNNKINRFFF